MSVPVLSRRSVAACRSGGSRNTPAARAQQPRQEEVDMPRTRVLAAMLPALALVAVGAVASANPTTTHTRYALRTTLGPAPDAIGAAHAHGRFTGSITLDGTTRTLRWTLTYAGLTGPATMGPTHLAPAGKILLPLCPPCHTAQGGSLSGPARGHS